MSTFNGSKFIREQLQSIVNQDTDARIVLYVRDDGSIDNTCTILNEFDGAIETVQASLKDNTNLGPAKSFWHLFQSAPVADYYCFADQDDIWDSDKISSAIYAIDNLSLGPALYCCNSRLIDEDGCVLQCNNHKHTPIFQVISQLVGAEIPGCAMFLNASMRESILSSEIHNIPMHDWVIVLNAIILGKIIFDPIPRFSRRIHAHNVIARPKNSGRFKISQTMQRWKSQSGQELGMSSDILHNHRSLLDSNTIRYLERLCNCKNNIIHRAMLILDKKTVSNNKYSENAFKLRIFLGII
jgi:rhamnosyltransferase